MTPDRVLFDAPGPRTRRRIGIITVLSLLAFVSVVVGALRQFSQHGQLVSDRWQPFSQTDYIRFLWDGLKGTLRVTAVSAVIAFPAGALLALLRLSLSRPVRYLATAYIELFRSLPLLLLIYAFLLALPRYDVNLPIFWKLAVPIAMVNAAVLAEIFRAGVCGLDRGQVEAASAIGLRYWQSMRLIVLPQAVRLVLPTLVAQLVSLLKDSTLGYVVSYPELMKQANNLTVYTHLLIQTYLIVAVVYVLINFALSHLANLVERKLRRRGVQGRVVAPLGATGAPARYSPRRTIQCLKGRLTSKDPYTSAWTTHTSSRSNMDARGPVSQRSDSEAPAVGRQPSGSSCLTKEDCETPSDR